MTATLDLMILQTPADLGMPSDRLAWLKAWLDQADLMDIDLILLPELFQTGYNAADIIPDLAEASDGMFFQSMAGLSRQHQLAIAYGYAERVHDRIYNAAQVIDAMGNSVANHRKRAIPPGLESALFDTGQHMTQFSLKGIEVGMLICYDAEFPEYMRAMAMAGAELVLVPTALSDQWDVVAERVIPSRGFENGIHVAYANHCGMDKGLGFLGKSCIISPTGVDLARADSSSDAMAIQASISRDAVKAAQARLPYLTECKTLSL
ncbi:MAG: carbon-nitrogen hydrolase family protein [Candidatus Puniceispirillales bacterium]